MQQSSFTDPNPFIQFNFGDIPEDDWRAPQAPRAEESPLVLPGRAEIRGRHLGDAALGNGGDAALGTGNDVAHWAEESPLVHPGRAEVRGWHLLAFGRH